MEERKAYLEEMKRTRGYALDYHKVLVAEDLPYVPLWHSRIFAAHRRHVAGFRLYPAGDFTPLARVTLGPTP